MIKAPPGHLQRAVERRSISGSFSHLWSDALFSRQRAIEAHLRAQDIATFLMREEANQPGAGWGLSRDRAHLMQCKWDCGTFTRWTVITAWMAFERGCGIAVDDKKIGYGFKNHLNDALKAKGAEPLNRGKGLWQRVEKVRERRNMYVHDDRDPDDFPDDVEVAKSVIATLREGLIDLHRIVKTAHPPWIECDEIPMPLGGSSAWMTVVHAGADDDPEAIRIVAVFGGEEHESSRMRHDRDPWPDVEQLINSVRVPITAVRVYAGDRLEHEIEVRLRGSAEPDL